MRITRRELFAKLTFLLTGIVSILFSVKKSRATTPEMIAINHGHIIPSLDPDLHAKPEIFPSTNNLRRRNGSPFLAKGTMLIIHGYATDLIDIPLDNIKLKIWQTNHFGYYHTMVDAEDQDKYDQDFLFAGSAVTNNYGYYAFITIMPGYYGNRAPHVHFAIEGEYFDPLETEMFFPNHPRNLKDQKYNNMSLKDRSLATCILRNIRQESPDEGQIAIFNIKLNVLHPHKRY